jgi:hypothetical protein
MDLGDLAIPPYWWRIQQVQTWSWALGHGCLAWTRLFRPLGRGIGKLTREKNHLTVTAQRLDTAAATRSYLLGRRPKRRGSHFAITCR